MIIVLSTQLVMELADSLLAGDVYLCIEWCSRLI